MKSGILFVIELVALRSDFLLGMQQGCHSESPDCVKMI